MSAFVDSSFILAYLHPGQPNHPEAKELLRAARSGRLGSLMTSDFVCDETLTVALRKFGPEGARRAEAFLAEPGFMALLRVTPAEVDEARRRFLAGLDTRLSVTDWTIVVQCEARGVGTILSFDKGLDGVYRRNIVPGPGRPSGS